MTDLEMRAFPARSRPTCVTTLTLALAAVGAIVPSVAHADKIKHPIAVFSGLDKITGRIISFEVATDETVQFGSLQITERACYTRPATETPQTTTFIEVDEVDAANDYKRIFAGWMFAASPGLHGVEHPIYDIWLTGCKGGAEEPVAVAPNLDEPASLEAVGPKPAPEKKPPRQRRPPPTDDLADEPPALEQGPIEVGPPPGSAPSAPRQRRTPAQRYYATPPAPQRDPFTDGY
jgi:hypothetical protein